ncbi:Uma2 family endonuclease [Pedobacter frigiditerrae]|uniref:Uma2 family endonuclease n=1 Tax=Pedobacter frigiditerrae TaxID=2530452 RepID=A0A4R0MS36_9SPHI|nr:Uma2 family endonuclease [Pedobacter frigiditerrae]TCC89447.1 Uma2 family endonuclease [Pedobacter frigiditerrae]
MAAEKTYPDLTDAKVYSFNDVDESLTYSYSHYLNWLFDERVELIKGKVFKMSPAPSRVHQEVSFSISLAIGNFLKNKSCKIYCAPFDVRFPKKSKLDKDVFTVLQPDICVVCDLTKLDDKGCIGAPDIVVEILSPGNNKKELFHKYQVYEEFGVKEYWVVSQSDQSILIYTLDEFGKFQPSKIFTLGEEITSSILLGFVLNLDEVFGG